MYMYILEVKVQDSNLGHIRLRTYIQTYNVHVGLDQSCMYMTDTTSYIIFIIIVRTTIIIILYIILKNVIKIKISILYNRPYKVEINFQLILHVHVNCFTQLYIKLYYSFDIPVNYIVILFIYTCTFPASRMLKVLMKKACQCLKEADDEWCIPCCQ